MRTTLLMTCLAGVLAACEGNPSPTIDAPGSSLDGPIVDAAPDAPPSIAITTACQHMCEATSACFTVPVDPACYTGCATELADCTAQQVQAVDSCSTEACVEGESSPLVDCMAMIACIDM